jgi:hypothetical protein
LAIVGLCAFVPAAYAQYDNSNDDVECQTITKGVLKFKPFLNNVDQGAGTIKVSGTLGACKSNTHATLVFPEAKSKFKGLLNSPTSGCLGLLGPSGASGTITLTFKATDGVGGPGLLFPTSTVTVTAGDSVGGLATIGNGAYGQFGLGTGGGGTALAVSGGFTGGDGGATSDALIFTQQAADTLSTFCGQTPPLGIKGINIGVGTIHLQ